MEERIVEFFSKHGKNVLYGSLVVLLGAFAIYRFFFSAPNQEYIEAKLALEKLRQDKGNFNIETASRIKLLLNKNDSLAKNLSGQVAQEFAKKGQWKEAAPFAKEAQSVCVHACPLYKQYEETTFLIIDEKYEEALNQSLHLDDTLQDPPSKELKILQAYNLLRIIALQQKLGLPEEEKRSLEKYRAFEHENPEIAFKINQAFQLGVCCLHDLLDERMKKYQNIN